jgi:hypothetical protein
MNTATACNRSLPQRAHQPHHQARHLLLINLTKHSWIGHTPPDHASPLYNAVAHPNSCMHPAACLQCESSGCKAFDQKETQGPPVPSRKGHTNCHWLRAYAHLNTMLPLLCSCLLRQPQCTWQVITHGNGTRIKQDSAPQSLDKQSTRC